MYRRLMKMVQGLPGVRAKGPEQGPRWKGVILAGGCATRLHPTTQATCKHLLPIYDKPMIYYPLATLMYAGIREILVITTPHDAPAFRRLLGDGAQWGLEIRYAKQKRPEGIAQALTIAEKFLNGANCALILGDNIFYSEALEDMLRKAQTHEHGATVFGVRVPDPERYGVMEFDATGKVTFLEEKPIEPRSHMAVSGLYFFDAQASELAKNVTPSPRGELEITSVNQQYLQRGELRVQLLDDTCTYFDAGTYDALLEASQFVRHTQHKLGASIACPEAIAYQKGYIDAAQIAAQAQSMHKTSYGSYLARLPEASRLSEAPSALPQLHNHL